LSTYFEPDLKNRKSNFLIVFKNYNLKQGIESKYIEINLFNGKYLQLRIIVARVLKEVNKL